MKLSTFSERSYHADDAPSTSSLVRKLLPFCSLIELIAYKISKQNLIFASLIGNVLAYRLAHFGYMPLNSYKILIAIGINLLILYLIFKLINYFYRK